MELRKPPRVRPGDTVAVVSPSFGAVGLWPHRVERATAYLESLGLRVRLMPNAARSEGWAAAPPEDRVADLHTAFADDEIAVVLRGIGGNHSNQLLPLLDFDLIREHPKIFQGYSDITVLHWAFAKHAGLCTFHGPALVPELGEFPQVLADTDRSLRAAWFGGEPIVYQPSAVWTDEVLDWDTAADSTRARAEARIVARPYGYTPEARERLWEVVASRTEAAGRPVLADVEAGHTDPMVTFPFGVTAEIDAGPTTLRLLEAPTTAA